jgi:hypothetical protein
MNDSRERTDCKVRAGFTAATLTANAPVSSATLSLVEDTAAAVAPPRSEMRPSAAVIHAIVLAVPITPQVPAYILSELTQMDYDSLVEATEGHTDGASSSLTAEISSTSMSPALNAAHLFLQSVQAPIRAPL